MKEKRRNKNFPAMSLIEVIVYLALFGVIFLLIIQFVIDTNKNNNFSRHRNIIEKTGLFTFRHLDLNIKPGITLDEVQSVFDTESGKIVFTKDAIIYQYYILNNRLYFNDGTETSEMLDPNIKINSLLVQKVINNDETVGIRVSIELESISMETVTKNVSTMYLIK